MAFGQFLRLLCRNGAKLSEFVAIATDFTAPPGAEGQARPEVARATAAPGGDRVRPCTQNDLRQVAMLFQHVFRKRRGEPPQQLIEHLNEVYFRHPWNHASLPSLVLEREDGTLDGFIGVIPLKLEFRGKPLMGSVAGAFMVRDPEQRPLAAARLMRGHISGPQQVSFGDTTNGPARAMWEKLGGHMLPVASMEWLKVIRLVPFGVSSALSRAPALVSMVLQPVAVAIDRLSWMLRRRPAAKADWLSETVGDDAYLAAANQVSARLDLRLARDDEAGLWLLGMAAQKRRYGPLHRRVVANRAGKAVGCYLVYCRRGAPAETLQIVTTARDAQAVLDDLIAFAASQGCTAVRGRTQGPIIDAVFRAGCLMRHRSATVYRTADADLRMALERGQIALGGFYGETWTRLVSDEFGAPSGTFGGHG